ncbi:MAG TPA: choice-of-anchor tandem repeat GloVer-containing protein, partial [Gemmataceae bacterium]|nr:choice-of-anchor tandem repeat GloVer-containing protein [Gemmataceae bacterium]
MEVAPLEERQLLSTLTALAPFNSTNGANPIGGLMEDHNGNFFGTTQSGGANGEGTVFELPAGSSTLTVLASFSNSTGTFPQAGLIEDSSGNLFGTTSNGGANGKGTVFELVAGSSTITALASFNGTNGANPVSSLFEDVSGNLFGVAEFGGTNNFGTIFELPSGSSTITALASFNNTNGANPVGNLIEDGNGNLFGTTVNGGANSVGTVFELPSGSSTVTVLASFNNTNGAQPISGLIEDGNGNFFGTAQSGGTNGVGTIYELASGSSTITALASFSTATGSFPYGSLIMDSSGNFFGTTQNGGANGNGTVFELPSGSSTITPLASFNSTNGATPTGNLIEDNNGDLFGTAYAGGPNSDGTVFEFGQRPSITLQPQTTTATVGQAGSVSLTVAANEGSASLSYQWQISTDHGVTFNNLNDGNGVAGSATATLTLNNFSTSGSPEYQVLVSDDNTGSTTSHIATVMINAATSIATQPTSQSVTAGQASSVSFHIVAANGTGPLTYQWKLSTDGGLTFNNVGNSSGITGATTATLSIGSSAFPASGAEYEAVV